MNSIRPTIVLDDTEQTRREIAWLKAWLESETAPEIRVDIQDEILCLAESWFVGQMLSEDELWV